MDKARLENRRKDFKKNIENPRRRREDAQVQIRKTHREAQVMKKRAQMNSYPELYTNEQMDKEASSIDLSAAVQSALSDDIKLQFEATQQFRKLLAVDQRPPIKAVIDTGIVPRLITFLRENSRPELQLEAAWTLTNIASGTQDQTRVVTDNGAIPIFVELLKSPVEDVRDQAVWALGNIAGDCSALRDLVLRAGGMVPLLKQLGENSKDRMMRNATWALSNLCRGSPPPSFEFVAPAVPMLKRLIHSSDSEVLTDACWALSYLLDTKNHKHIDHILATGVCSRLVELLVHPSDLVQNPALRSVGQIIAGTHDQTEIVIEAGVLKPLLQLLSSPRLPIRKEACWVVSNIAAGTQGQIQSLINAGFLEPLIFLLSNGEFEVRREVAWAISNAVIGGDTNQIEFIVNSGSIRPLCDLLSSQDKHTVQVALEAIDNMLRVGQMKKEQMHHPENPYLQLVEEAEGFSKLENLQFTDTGSDVYKTVIRILTSYFPVEEQDFEVEHMARSQGQNNMGPFGAKLPTEGFSFGNSGAPTVG